LDPAIDEDGEEAPRFTQVGAVDAHDDVLRRAVRVEIGLQRQGQTGVGELAILGDGGDAAQPFAVENTCLPPMLVDATNVDTEDFASGGFDLEIDSPGCGRGGGAGRR